MRDREEETRFWAGEDIEQRDIRIEEKERRIEQRVKGKRIIHRRDCWESDKNEEAKEFGWWERGEDTGGERQGDTEGEKQKGLLRGRDRRSKAEGEAQNWSETQGNRGKKQRERQWGDRGEEVEKIY